MESTCGTEEENESEELNDYDLSKQEIDVDINSFDGDTETEDSSDYSKVLSSLQEETSNIPSHNSISSEPIDEKGANTQVDMVMSGKIKRENDKGTKTIVLNRYSKFQARKKLDPSQMRYFCSRCDEGFRFPYQLTRHTEVKHEGKYPYSCEVCGKSFDRISSKRDHLLVHSDDRPFECMVCHKKFKMKGSLQKHMRDIHTDTKLQFQCEYCSKVFPTKERLMSHFLVHDDEKAFECNICGKRFNRKNNLQDHMLTHSTEKNYKCPDCHMCFNRRYSLKLHARNHLAVKPYRCELCPMSFSQLHALKTHFRQHTGEKPFKCSICQRTFRQQSTLQTHFKRHSGIKDWVCKVCGRGFVVKRRLVEHERLHTGEKPFSCDLCPYRAATSGGLRFHKKTHLRQMARQALKEVEQMEETSNSADTTVSDVMDEIVKATDKFENKDGEQNMDSIDNTQMDSNYDPDMSQSEGLIEIVNEHGHVEKLNVTINSDDIDDDVKQMNNFVEEPANVNNNNSIEISIGADRVEKTDFLESEVKGQITLANTDSTADQSSLLVEEKGLDLQAVGSKPKRVFKRKRNPRDIDINMMKEVLYKHLNEFIPTIDGDALSEKIDTISKDFMELLYPPPSPAPNKTKVATPKTSGKKAARKKATSKENISNSSTDIQQLNDSSSLAVFPAVYSPSGNPVVAPAAVPLPSTSTPTLIRELMKPLDKVKKRIIRRSKPLPYVKLRDILSTENPDFRPQKSMNPQPNGSVLHAGPGPALSSKGLSWNKPSTVLRSILSAPPKDYLLATKNSFNTSLVTQQLLASRNVKTEGRESSSYKSEDFPWVEDPDPLRRNGTLPEVPAPPCRNGTSPDDLAQSSTNDTSSGDFPWKPATNSIPSTSPDTMKPIGVDLKTIKMEPISP